jgi:hypothetical protein
MSLIKLPVSIGEAIDKLTILDIKYEMIKDSRRDDCKKEYDMLMTELKDFITDKNNYYYFNILRYINLKIWKDQDIIRNLKDDSKIGKLSIQILKDNDARFRIKKIINDVSNSELKEQKGYNKTRAVFLGHMGMGDFFNLNGAIRYISILYDEVILFCPFQYASNIKQMFCDLNNIKYLEVDKNNLYTKITKEALEITSEVKIDSLYKSGYQLNINADVSRIPLSFYDEMNIDREVMKVFSKITKTHTSLNLKNILEGKFVNGYSLYHLVGSANSNSYQFDAINNSIKNDPDHLVIDVRENRYPIDHKYYEIANLFINLPILDYCDIIMTAKELHFVNSSFFCLAARICDNKDQIKVCYCDQDLTYLDGYYCGWTYKKLSV